MVAMAGKFLYEVSEVDADKMTAIYNSFERTCAQNHLIADMGTVINALEQQLAEVRQLTPLERAVVEAAVAYREAQTQSWVQGEVADEGAAKVAKETERQAGIKLMLVSEDLVLARRNHGKGGAG